MMGPEIASPPDAKLTVLDPPSYADAIFRPADPLTPGDPTSPYLELTVTDPLQENDNTFTTYLITTRVRNAPSPFIVRRRFRHVVALAERLAQAHRGYFIPVRPDKSVAKGPEFLEQRRADLERYLRRIVRHPVVGCGEAIRAFLREEEFGEGGAAAGGGRDFVRIFKEMTQSVANDWVGTRGGDEEEREFRERKGRVQEFGLQLNATSEQVFGF